MAQERASLEGAVKGEGTLPWTLGARLDGDVLEFTLGDGRRLAWRSRRAAALLDHPASELTVAAVLGAELGQRLADSPPRVLHLQLDDALDGFDWELLGLGFSTLADHFDVGRALLGNTEPPALLAPALGEALRVVCIHQDARPCGPWCHGVLAAEVDDPVAGELILRAHVLVLDDVALERMVAVPGCRRQPRLLVLNRLPPPRDVAASLDEGAALLAPTACDGAALRPLLSQLGSGASVAQAVRHHARSQVGGARPAPRLYGDPALRFVRSREPTSLRQVTSLSLDVVGSTRAIWALGDEPYAELIPELLTRCMDIARRRHGHPNDPQGGDGFMCYFGHPVALESSAVHAVQAALEMVRCAAESGCAVRVGITTDQVVIQDGQPFGKPVHLADRLQKAADPGTVLVAHATRELARHAFQWEEVARRLKDIPDDQPVYLVLGPAEDGSGDIDESSPVTPFVGRRAELAALQSCWRRTGRGQTRLAQVTGEAGMGKSRLVREFRVALARAGVKVLECRCRLDARASPYLALAEAFRRWTGIGAEENADAARAKLVAALPESAGGEQPLALLAALLGIGPHPPATTPGVHRQRLLSALLACFDRFARGTACCFIVEDWHWVDPSMRDLVEALLRTDRSDGPGLMVVLTTRGTGLGAPLSTRPDARIELLGLGPDESRLLVDRASAASPLPLWQVRLLAGRGDGVPLFLEEATRMAIALGADRSALTTVPRGLNDLLTARLDGLGDAKSLAEVAAVIGRDFDMASLRALLVATGGLRDSAALAERLSQLVASGLVRATGEGRYGFKHALVRDAAYAMLAGRRRSALHARMVELLAAGTAGKVPAETLALHLTEAGMCRQALAQWQRAASEAAARSADLEAISHLRSALAVLPRAESGIERNRTALRLQLLLAARLITTEGYGAPAVLEAYQEAERLCDSIGDETARFKVEMGLESYRFMHAEFSAALAHGERAAAIAERSGDTKQRLHAHWGLACTLFHQGELRASMREMETGLALYTPGLQGRFGAQDPGIMCMAYSSWGLWELGRPDAALARIRQACAIAAESEHRFSEAVALAYGVAVELLRGDTEAALARAAVCLRVCDEGGYPVWEAITRCMRGRLLCERGELETGLAEMRAGHEQWLATGARVSRPLYLSLQTEGLMIAGDFPAARACVDEGLAAIASCGERQLEAELLRLQGQLALERGAVAEGEAWLRRAYALAMRGHRLGFALRSATALARLWDRQGRRERARRLLAPLLARWSEGHATRDVAQARRVCRGWECVEH